MALDESPLRLNKAGLRLEAPGFEGEAGFSLMETLVATLLLSVSLVSIAQLFVVSTRANLMAKTTTATAIMAQQKMEQLRSLTWGFDGGGAPISDFMTNTAVNPPAAGGGTGLSASPGNTLRANTAGYVDYLDANGQALGGGADPPAGALYVRRWSIEPLPANPSNTLVLQVFVFRVDGRGNNLPEGAVSRFPEEARLVTVKTRKVR
jgi:type II secretory pathway pseudopilin PulG